MKKFVSNILLYVFLGNLLAAGVGFIAILVVSRTLTVSDYGLFTMGLSAIFAGALIADFGINRSMLKHIGSLISLNKNNSAKELMGNALMLKTFHALCIGILIFFSADTISQKVLSVPEFSEILMIVSAGIIFRSLFDAMKAAFYSFQRIKVSLFLQFIFDFSKLLLVTLALSFSLLTLPFAFAIFAFSPLFATLFGAFFLEKGIFHFNKKVIHTLFSLSKWIFTIDILEMLFLNSGIFLLVSIMDKEAAGIYGLAFTLSYVFVIFISSCYNVLLPKLSGFTNKAQYRNYLNTAIKVLCISLLLSIPFLYYSRDFIVLFLEVTMQKRQLF